MSGRTSATRGGAVVLALLVTSVGLWAAAEATLNEGRAPRVERSEAARHAAANGKIAFDSTQDGVGDIYVMNPDGSGVRNLTETDDVSEYGPAWSPDGRRIAFVGCRECTTSDIYVMNADGTGVRRVTHDYALDGDPTWSSDGTRIAFTSGKGEGADIYVVNTDGAARIQLTNTPATHESSPTWSPDGTRIAFQRGGWEGDVASIYVVNSDGTGERPVLYNSWAFSPAWSPDGRKIAFSIIDLSTTTARPYVMNPDGSRVRRLAKVVGGDPEWSPDGRTVLVPGVGRPPRYRHVVYTIEFASGTVSRLYTAPPGDGVYIHTVAWQPVQGGETKMRSASLSDARSSATEEPTPGRRRAVAGRPSPPPELVQLAVRGRSVWALFCDRRCHSNDGRNSVGRAARLDPATGKVLASVHVRTPHALAIGEGGVWVISFWEDTLMQIDPQSNAVIATVKLALPFEVGEGDREFLPIDVAAGEGAVWVVTGRGVVARVDPDENGITRMISIPGHITCGDVAVGQGGVWVSACLRGLYRIDAESGRITAQIRVGTSKRRLQVEEVEVGEYWVFGTGGWARRTRVDWGGHPEYVAAKGSSIVRIDPRSNRVAGFIGPSTAEGGRARLVFGEGMLWLPAKAGHSVLGVDPSTGEVLSTVEIRRDERLVAVGRSAIWFADSDGALRPIPLDPA